MSDPDSLQRDLVRMAKLKALAAAGQIDGKSSYFNHLIDIYGGVSQLRPNRTITDTERKRIDVFLANFPK